MPTRQPSIMNWVSSSATADAAADSEDDSASQGTELTWKIATGSGRRSIITSKQSVRIPFLRNQLLPLVKVTDAESVAQVLELFEILFDTIPRYDDASSRQAVLKVVEVVLRKDCAEERSDSQGLRATVIDWISRDIKTLCPSTYGGASGAPGTRLSILGWTCKLLEVYFSEIPEAASPSSSPNFLRLIDAMGLILDSFQDSACNRPSIKNSALVITRRLVRCNHQRIPELFKYLTQDSSSPQNATLLGLTIDVSLRLRVGREIVKGTPEGVGVGYVADHKLLILQWWVKKVLGSKTPLPIWTTSVFEDFCKRVITSDDFSQHVSSAASKLLLRSPEVSMPALNLFMKMTPGSVGPATQKDFFPVLVSAVKSSKSETRETALSFFKTLFEDEDSDVLAKVVEEISLPLKTGKTSGSEHRAALITMLAFIKPGQSFSPMLIKLFCDLLVKETNENALSALSLAIQIHLKFLLNSGINFDSSFIQAISKAMQDSKPLIRKAACQAIALSLWRPSGDNEKSPGEKPRPILSPESQTSLAKALEVNLKNASTNPLTSVAGPLEGYIAVALCSSACLRDWSTIRTMWKENPILSTIGVASPKPSFLFMDRLYHKQAATTDDSIWLARSLDSIFDLVKPDLGNNLTFRNLFAQAVLFLVTETSSHEARSLSAELVCEWFKRAPMILFSTLVHGLNDRFLKESAQKGSQKLLGARLRSLMETLFKESRLFDAQIRSQMLVDCFVICHSNLLDNSSSFWISLVRAAALDPEEVVSSNYNSLSQNIESTIPKSKEGDESLTDAAYLATKTLVLVAPTLALPEIVERVIELLDPEMVTYIQEFEIGVWKTPPEQNFLDVLPLQKTTIVSSNSAGDKSIEKWEMEVRESIEKKKAGGAKIFTKTEKELVEDQSKKEAEIRRKVEGSVFNLRHGFRLIKCLIRAREVTDDPIADYFASIVERCLRALQTEASSLVKEEGFSAFSSLASLTIEKLASLRLPLTLCILRGLNTKVVPGEMAIESLKDLVTRILYKVRSLAEQQAIDQKTFSYIAPLLSQVIRKRGIGLDSSQVEEVVEQIALVVDIMSFSAAEAAKVHDLRSKLIEDCLSVIGGYPQLIKAATTGLISIGSALAPDASDADIRVLLSGFLHPEAQARYAALQAAQPLDMTDIEWSSELWTICHDEDERNASLASDLWVENGFAIPPDCLKSLLLLLEHHAPLIRKSAAKSLPRVVQQHPQLTKAALNEISERYQVLAKELLPEYDRFGMIIPESIEREDPWKHRVALANALYQLAPHWSEAEILPLFSFLVEQSLRDRHEEVRTSMLAAGNAAIDLHGSVHLEKLISVFQLTLLKSSTLSETDDYVTEAAALLLGRLAQHLDANDSRLIEVIERLIEALKTPSESVQSAVSDCLPPLIRLRKENAPIYIQKLLENTLNSLKYAERRGAAYGLAGAVKGRGLTSIKEFSIADRLRDALEDKKNVRARQGALFGFEVLAGTLGRLFEPYLIQTVPALLAAFGDSAAEVREAIQDTARSIMRGLSGHAVKLILPSLLAGLDDKQWRTKKGAIELMGAMAYLAPKQLSMSLPTIIPRLTEVLTDTHAQVRSAANSSLKRFGEVVSSPEISAMQDVLLAALVDPARKTGKALDSLLSTAFVHYVDSSSLALLVPIIERGLKERTADVKRKSTQIVGNLATLAEAKDLSPYLPQLVPKVRQVLVDPVPEARATAAKALGSLVERLGEESFPDLVPSLLDTLRTDAPGIDQQGAAQGLSEIMSGLGTEKLDDILPEIILNTGSSKVYVREGFISLLIFLPATYGERFSPYLGRIIRPVLNGLADDSDYVREASMRAGRMIITNHSTKAVELLLPELEQGLFHESWRIRQSSVQLLGDLLFRVSGITSKAELEQEDVEEEETTLPSAEASRAALVEALGNDCRDRVLAAVYIIRQDSSGIVRSASVHIWKALVNNTPKVVREIMPTLMRILIRILASKGQEQRETAARTLGELVKKLGENILGTITSVLQKALASDDVHIRQGVGMAIIYVIASISHAQLENHQASFLAIVRLALVDSDESVRTAASKAFLSLQQRLGARAIDDTLPTLLNALRQPGSTSETALDALKELMRAGASSILAQLLPVITKQPISTFNAKVLASLLPVSGDAVTQFICSVVDNLRLSWKTEIDDEVRGSLNSSLRVIFGSLKELDSVNVLMMHLIGLSKSEDSTSRQDGCELFAIFCSSNTTDWSDYYLLWIRQLVSMLDDPVSKVVDSAWWTMDEMVKAMDKTEMNSLVTHLRRAIEALGKPGQEVSGFCRPMGLKPLLPILLQGMLAGAADQREQAALAFGNLVERTSQEYVKPYVTQIAGPLIRVMGERFPAPVKSAILQTFSVLLTRIPQYIRPFFPQLQRTFIKSASDGSSATVRNKAVIALGLLMKHQPRIDPLVSEILGYTRTFEEVDLQSTMISALAAMVLNGGTNITQSPMNDIVNFVDETLQEPLISDSIAEALSRLICALGKVKASCITNFMSYIIVEPPTPLAAMCARELIENAGEVVYKLDIQQELVSFVLKSLTGGV
ncbi:armadillo-type protein, partial [Phakopsora pachyrhizi]